MALLTRRADPTRHPSIKERRPGVTVPRPFPGRPRPEGREQVADLVVHLGRVGQRGGDLLAEQVAVPAAEPVGGHPRGPLGRPEAGGDRRVRRCVGVPVEHAAEGLEGRPLAGLVVLPAEPVEHPPQQGQGPGPVEDAVRGQPVGQLAGVLALGPCRVDREDGPAAPALPGVLPVAAVSEEMGAHRAQKRAEPPAGRVGLRQQAPLQGAGEEVLGQVPGLLRVVAPTADVGV